MSDKDEKEVDQKDKSEDYEKRYKDSQAHISQIEAENKALREAQEKDKELIDTVSPYIDWEALNGTKKPVTEDDDGYVDKKTLNKTIEDLQQKINQQALTQSFRVKHPDMIEHEDLVAMYIGKTDPRKKPVERLEKAVELAKKLIESERVKGRKEYEKEKKEAAAKEAEAAGLGGGKSAKGEDKEPEVESFEDYIAFRKAQSQKQWAPDTRFVKGAK